MYVTCYFYWHMPQNVQFPDGDKKIKEFPMGEKLLTQTARHDLMEEKINGARKAWAMHFTMISLLSMLVRTIHI